MIERWCAIVSTQIVILLSGTLIINPFIPSFLESVRRTDGTHGAWAMLLTVAAFALIFQMLKRRASMTGGRIILAATLFWGGLALRTIDTPILGG